MVGRYMNQNLTKLEDRLPALAGVAREVHRVAQTDYLAGLWRDDMFAGLLWYCTFQGISQIKAQWRAPSWSWASLESHITWVSHQLDKKSDGACIEILEAECKPRTVDPFGAVCEGAFLRLRAKMVETEFGHDVSRFSPDLCVRHGFKQEFAKDVRRLTPEPELLYEGDKLHCLLLWDPPEDRSFILVLREVKKADWESLRVFERIGLVGQASPQAPDWFEGVDVTELVLVKEFGRAQMK